MTKASVNVGASQFVVNYEWDQKNQLTSVSGPGFTSVYKYDQFGRRTQIIDYTLPGFPFQTRYFIWDGLRIVEERTSPGGAPVKRFYSQGEMRGATKYFYTKDHLGSTREVVDASGNLKARYNYDPYGAPVRTAGSMDFDFLYTGHFYHAKTELYLAPYRAYNSKLGRWLSRDPIGIKGGLNLYGYVGNNPLNSIDLSGLITIQILPNPQNHTFHFNLTLSVNGPFAIYKGPLRLCTDGIGPDHNDPHQLPLVGGRSGINADTVPYIVAPLDTANIYPHGTPATVTFGEQSVSGTIIEYGPPANGWGEVSMYTAAQLEFPGRAPLSP